MTYVNLVTGFLGSGKTTTLRHLLAMKPAHENWAILVNEFGEIGIDGALLAEQGAVLKEIPGGCMCCVNGLPMQIGLNMLLKQHRPDRLLIEPTGLGHPKQILTMLNADSYRPWFELRATLCVLDPRHLLEKRVVENENFRDQLAVADIIVANKSDRADTASQSALQQWYQQQGNQRLLVNTERGQIAVALLDTPRRNQTRLPDAQHHSHRASHVPAIMNHLQLGPQQRWRRAINEGQGYVTCGWIFDDETVFDTVGILEWIRQVPVARAKGVIRIAEGALMVNRQGEDLHIETRQSPPLDSRIELIHEGNIAWNELQSTLLKIRLS